MDPMSGFDIRLVFTLPPRENWFQYVRREYATAINFPCIITLLLGTFTLELETNFFYNKYILEGIELISRDPPIKNPSNKVIDKKVFDKNIRKKRKSIKAL